jgi:hypothetical protein
MLLVQTLRWTRRHSEPSPHPLQAGYLRNEWRLAGRQHWLHQPPRNCLLAWSCSFLAGCPFVHPSVHTHFSPPRSLRNRAARTTTPVPVATMGSCACALPGHSMFRASTLPEDAAPVDLHRLRLSPAHGETTEAQVSTFPVRRIESAPATGAQVDPALRRSETQQPRKRKSKLRACPAVQPMLISWSRLFGSFGDQRK